MPHCFFGGTNITLRAALLEKAVVVDGGEGTRGSPIEAQRIKKVGAFLYQSFYRWFFTLVLTASVAGYSGDKFTASYPSLFRSA